MHETGIGGTIVSAGVLDRLAHRQTLLTHVWPFLHLPQVSVPPQPSAVVPQFITSLRTSRECTHLLQFDQRPRPAKRNRGADVLRYPESGSLRQ